jgi:hypothetical protein
MTVTSTTAELGGKAWLDTNNNGIQDAGELGVAGVQFTLTDLYSGAKFQTVTDTTGNYVFSNLVPSYYYVVLEKTTLPAGYNITLPYQTPDQTLDSDFATWNGSAYFDLSAGQSLLTVDGGISDKKGSIGDKVWLDNSPTHSGNIGLTAPGVQGVTVTLYQAGADIQFGTADDVVVATQITDANGNYKFDNLLDGAYQVGFSNIGANNSFTKSYASAIGYSSVDLATGRTYEIDLNGAQNIDYADAGIRNNLGSISGLAWDDSNGDGWQVENVGTNLPLPIIANLTVKLYQAGADNVFGNADDVLVATQITDANGQYAFGNLAAGQYQVEFSLPNANSVLTSSDGTGDFVGFVGGNAVYFAPSYYVNSDVVGNSHRTATLDIAPLQDVSSIDAGVTSNQTAIGDRVWGDTNFDGIQDAGEQGIAGVTVQLLDTNGSVLNSAVTDQNGLYLFQGLSAGNYAIHVIAPTGYGYSPQNTFTYLGNSSVNLQGSTPVFALSTYEKTMEKDVGLVKSATIGDTVWNDENHNGIQDSGEKGMAGITVNIYSTTNSNAQSTVTDANGHYAFDVIPGQYYLDVSLPSNYAFSPYQQGSNPQLDSNFLSYGFHEFINVAAGVNNPDVDAGIFAVSTIGGKAWMDTNGDGLQNPEEVIGAYGASVELLDESGQVISTTSTIEDGSYAFYNFNYNDAAGNYHNESITAGNYKIHIIPLDSLFTFTQQGATSANQLGNSIVDTQGYSSLFSVANGEHKQTLDAGIQSNFSVGDKVWQDINKNGIQDAGEPGIAGVDVTLGSYTGTQYIQQQTTKTDVNGHYQFDHVAANFFEIDTVAPAGYLYSPSWQGLDSAVDSNSDAGVLYAAPYSTMGANSYDIGMYKNTDISIGDRVWEDENCNGVQDGGEWNKGIAGATVTLLNAQGAVVATQITDANGNYLFGLTTPGDYKIHVETPTGYVFTGQDQPPMYGYSDNSAVDSHGDTALFTVAAGDNVTNKDAGVYKKASIGDFVWNDANVNGIHDANENGMAGVTVNLLNASDANKFITSVVTDTTGHYSFDNVDLGNYTVQIVAPASYDFTYPQTGADPSLNSNVNIAGYSDPINIWVSGVQAHNINAGLFNNGGKGSIGDRVWEDANCNGLQDEGEWNKGIANVTVELLNNTGAIVSTTHTDSAGQYLFKNLDAGDYKVHVIAPDGYYSTTANIAHSVLGNSVIDATGLSPTISLAAGENDKSVDAGLYQKASFGDYVWVDVNQNGLQDAGEPGLGSVPVQLFGWINNQAFSQWAVTDSSGHYQFSNIDLGNYTIQVEAPTGYTFTQAFAGIDPSIDSNIGQNGLSQDIHVWISGINDMNLDAGLLAPATALAASASLPSLSSLLSSDTQVDTLLANIPATEPQPVATTVAAPITDITSLVDASSINIIGQLDNYANQISGLV